MNVGTESRAAIDRRTRHHLSHFLSGNFTEVAECRSSWRTYGGVGGSTHSSNLLDEELGKFVGVVSVEDDTGLCHD